MRLPRAYCNLWVSWLPHYPKTEKIKEPWSSQASLGRQEVNAAITLLLEELQSSVLSMGE